MTLYVVGGVLCASLYTIVAKRLDDGSDTLLLTTWQFSAASILSLPIVILKCSTGSGHPLVALSSPSQLRPSHGGFGLA